MNGQEQGAGRSVERQAADCTAARENFSAYLDGALDGRVMGQMAAHFQSCRECEAEFAAWRSMHTALSELRMAEVPRALESQLRDALAGELERGTYRSPTQRFGAFWRSYLLPAGMRLGAGLSAALVLVAGLTWLIGTVAPVQANDDRLAHLNAPRFLYSVTPPESVTTSNRFVAVMVDVKVNAEGRVYDYDIVEGPKDEETRTRIEANLLGSIFKPATVFGVPVPGHAMMTYTAVSVRG